MSAAAGMRRGGRERCEGVRDGLPALRAERVATVLVLFCALDSAVYGASTVLYVPISQQLGTGTDGFGYLLAGNALGGVIAAGVGQPSQRGIEVGADHSRRHRPASRALLR